MSASVNLFCALLAAMVWLSDGFNIAPIQGSAMLQRIPRPALCGPSSASFGPPKRPRMLRGWPARERKVISPLMCEPVDRDEVKDKESSDKVSRGTEFVDLGKESQRRFRPRLSDEEFQVTRPLMEDLREPIIALGSVAAALAAASSIPGVPPSLPLVMAFILGYFGIVFESEIDVNKSATALLMGVVCWGLVGPATGMSPDQVIHGLNECLSDIAQIVFFLIGAMAIVETVDAHRGFDLVTDKINTTDKRTLLIIVSSLAFVLSSVLDNLTTTIVMCSLLTKLVSDQDREMRQVLGGLVVIAANAGGAWSPIGDVTTTMLWIGGQVTAVPLMFNTLLPSIVCTGTAVAYEYVRLKDAAPVEQPMTKAAIVPRGQPLIFLIGVGGLLFVPVFKALTNLPPYTGMLVSLGALWGVTDRLHGSDVPNLKMPEALKRIDLAGSLFFIGILMAVGALQEAGVLTELSKFLAGVVSSEALLATIIGAASAVIDNVPLVAAAMGMYPLEVHPADAVFWDMIAYCAGTGGSMLIIGSAAGVAYMGLENVSFGWYLKKISPGAAVGYLAGIGTLVAQNKVVAALLGASAATVAAALQADTSNIVASVSSSF